MSLEELQRKIKTTDDLREIVSTMKALSSASILQYEHANKSLNIYQNNLRDAFHALVKQSNFSQITQKKFSTDNYLVLLIGSNNGMVGKFNRELLQAAETDLRHQHISPQQTVFLPIGKRMVMQLQQNKLKMQASYPVANSVKEVSSLAENIILQIDAAITKLKITHVIMWFHQRGKRGMVEITKTNLMPFDSTKIAHYKNTPWETNNIPLIANNPKMLFSALLRESLMISVSRALNLSLAAEHYTRMTNMQNEKKNIDENLAELDQKYQQIRQEEITDELIDIISGAEALKKNREKND